VAIEIKDYFASDIDDFWSWKPSDPQDVYFALSLNIGPEDEDGADIFEVVIATPLGLVGKARTGSNIIADRAILIVASYDRKEVLEHLGSILSKCASESWVESSQKLQRYFHWEYEDYVLA